MQTNDTRLLMQKWLLLLVLSSIGYVWLGYFTIRADFPQVLGLYSGLFVAYWVIVNSKASEEYFKFYVGAAILFRLSLFGMLPNLSDDFYRFVWDGRLIAQGFNPYLVLPADYQQLDLFNNLNSPDYYTVYPPLNQLFFALGGFIFPHNLLGHVIVLRLEILLADFGNLWVMLKILKKLGLPQKNALLYFLNPLVIYELTGNLHFEGVMTFFLLLGLLWINYYPNKLASIAIGLAASVKLLPLLFMPLIVKKLGMKRGLFFSLFTGLIFLLLFVPFLNNVLITNFLSSINLYFQKFEFNASLYYVVRELGYLIFHYNIIGIAGILLSVVTFVLILKLSLWKRVAFFDAALLTLSIYFSLATTVHPWYLCSLVALSIFTNFRYAILWSAVVVLSYHLYASQPFQENLWLVALEYGCVFGLMIVEIKRKLS